MKKFLAQIDPNRLTNPPNELANFYTSRGMTPGEILLMLVGIRNFVLFLGIVLVVIFIVRAGILYMGSGGDDKKIEDAKKSLRYALIGALITIAVFAILWFLIDIIQRASQGFSPLI